MPTGIANIILPMIEVSGTSSPPADLSVERFGLALNLPNLLASQYAHYNFNSMCQFGDVFLGANENGIMILDVTEADYGTAVSAFFELPPVDLGMARVRSVHVGYETEGSLLVKVQVDDGIITSYTLTPSILSRSHKDSFTIGRNQRGKYWVFRFENVNGANFEIDDLTIYPTILGARYPGGV